MGELMIDINLSKKSNVCEPLIRKSINEIWFTIVTVWLKCLSNNVDKKIKDSRELTYVSKDGDFTNGELLI